MPVCVHYCICACICIDVDPFVGRSVCPSVCLFVCLCAPVCMHSGRVVEPVLVGGRGVFQEVFTGSELHFG